MTRQPEWLTLDAGESVVWAGQPRTMSIAGTVVGATVRTVILLAVFWFVWSGRADAMVGIDALSIRSMVPGGVLLGGAALALLWAVVEVGWAYLTISNVDYVLTNRNLYKKTGVGSERTTRVGLDRIQSTSLSKDVFGTLFDYGSVAVSTAGGSGVEMVITDLADPDELRTELRRLVNQADGGGTGRPAPDGASSETLREIVSEARRLRETTAAVEEVLQR